MYVQAFENKKIVVGGPFSMVKYGVLDQNLEIMLLLIKILVIHCVSITILRSGHKTIGIVFPLPFGAMCFL